MVFRPDRARPYRRPRKFPDDLELEDRVEYERGRRDRSPFLAIFGGGKGYNGPSSSLPCWHSVPLRHYLFPCRSSRGNAQGDFRSGAFVYETPLLRAAS